MVSTAHPLATQVGVDILKKGGNAFDAAIAVQFALAVAYPRAGNIGGGGFLMYMDSSGKVGALDYREMAPSQATRDMYLDSLGNPFPNRSLKGPLAAGVPGSVDGMVTIYEKFGSLPWEELVKPAIQLAENGIELTEGEASKFNGYLTDFDSVNRFNIPVYKKEGWKKGEVIKYPELANTLRRISTNKRAGFYEGETADFIVDEMEAGGIQNGFVITEVDGKKVYSLKDLKEAFDKSGDYVTFRGLYSKGAMASFSFSW